MHMSSCCAQCATSCTLGVTRCTMPPFSYLCCLCCHAAASALLPAHPCLCARCTARRPCRPLRCRRCSVLVPSRIVTGASCVARRHRSLLLCCVCSHVCVSHAAVGSIPPRQLSACRSRRRFHPPHPRVVRSALPRLRRPFRCHPAACRSRRGAARCPCLLWFALSHLLRVRRTRFRLSLRVRRPAAVRCLQARSRVPVARAWRPCRLRPRPYAWCTTSPCCLPILAFPFGVAPALRALYRCHEVYDAGVLRVLRFRYRSPPPRALLALHVHY